MFYVCIANHQECSSSDESNESENDTEINSTYHSLTSIYVLNAIKKVLDKDMKPALLWLIDSLDEAAEDLDVDESDIPLLPLTDECMTAVSDKDFQEMMHILGIHKPSSIQVINICIDSLALFLFYLKISKTNYSF